MTDNAPGPPIGTVLDGKYRLTKQIGRGGMATIFSAENVDIGKPVAVKILARDLAESKTVTERFLREARAAARIKSPFICEVYDVGMFGDRPFIVMELLQGESLYDRLARERRLPVDDVTTIVAQVCRGLARAHEKQIVHRDLKPENIFLTTSEDGQSLSKLVDFGLAKFYEPTHDPKSVRLTKEGALFGTPAYMSPEQAKAKHNVDQRSDLWALGCIVYEMLTGRTVWDVEQGVAMILAQVATGGLPDPARYRPDLPAEFGVWFARALSRNVDERFQTAAEFAISLREALGVPPVSDVKSGLRSFENGLDRFSPPDTIPNPVPPTSSPPDEAPPLVESPSKKRGWLWALPLLGVLGVGGWFVRGVINKEALPPVETAAEGTLVSEAQKLWREGDHEEALQTLQAAFDDTKGKAARSLLSHLGAADEMKGGACKLKAVGHPRPFDADKESSKPSFALTADGSRLVAWAAAGSKGRITAYGALVDASLRRISEPVELTPASTYVREPELIHKAGVQGLVYWDFAGDQPGVYAVPLDNKGRATAGHRLISSKQSGHPYYPSIASHPEGGFVVVYVEPTRDRVHDLVARRLNDRFEPSGDPVALTGYATARNGKVQAARPSVAIRGDLLHVAYPVRRPAGQELLLLRVPLKALANGKGVEPSPAAKAPTASNEELDRFLGQVLVLSVGEGKFDWPTLRCAERGCYVAWDRALEAAELAFVDAAGKVAWRRRLTDPNSKGVAARPGIALAPTGVVAAWYQDDRVLVAPIDEGQPIAPSAAGRVAAVLSQPQPLVYPIDGDEFFIAWRGYEAAVPEPFVASVSCP